MSRDAKRSPRPAYRIADGPMSTPRRPAPRSSSAPMIATRLPSVTRLSCPKGPLPPSTSGPGHSPFKAVARVRIPLGAPGRLAQLGEHLPYKQGVTGSSPVPPITERAGNGTFREPVMRGRSVKFGPLERPWKASLLLPPSDVLLGNAELLRAQEGPFCTSTAGRVQKTFCEDDHDLCDDGSALV